MCCLQGNNILEILILVLRVRLDILIYVKCVFKFHSNSIKFILWTEHPLSKVEDTPQVGKDVQKISLNMFIIHMVVSFQFFNVVHFVHRLHPYTQSMYFQPFSVLEKVGMLAYKLWLPNTTRMHILRFLFLFLRRSCVRSKQFDGIGMTNSLVMFVSRNEPDRIL